MSSCFSRCLRVPIAIRAFYESYLWILQTLLLTHPDLPPGLLENFWSLLKRGLRGTYVCVEPSSGLFYFSSTRNHWQNSRLCWWFKPLYNHHGQPNHQHNRGSNIDGQFQLRL